MPLRNASLAGLAAGAPDVTADRTGRRGGQPSAPRPRAGSWPTGQGPQVAKGSGGSSAAPLLSSSVCGKSVLVTPASAPALEMLWEADDPRAALTTRFGFTDAAAAGRWVAATLVEGWGGHVGSCDRIVMSDRNALAGSTPPPAA